MNAGIIPNLFGTGANLFGPQGLFGHHEQQQQPQPGMFGGTARGNGISVNPDILRQAQFPRGMQPQMQPQMPQGAFPSIGGAEAMDPQQMPQQPPQRQPVLGGSMRQPFDYEAARAAMDPAAQQSAKKPGFNEPGGWGERLETIGAILRDNPEIYSQLLARQQAGQQASQKARTDLETWKHDDWARQNGADLRAASPFTVGRNRQQYDPASGEVATLAHGNADFEDYASAKGLEPGTPGYFSAVEDYVLRGNGPTALGYDQQLDDHRTGNRAGLEGTRQSNRVKLEGLRQGNRMSTRGSPTYRDAHPIARMPRIGAARPTATGPNGARIEFDGKAWVPVK